MKEPCEHCPFRSDVKPFLTAARGEELAYHAQNPYNTFPCHKTTVYDEESDDGDMVRTEKSKECAGFLTIMANELGEEEVTNMYEGFKPAYGVCYTDSWDMAQAYEEEANQRKAK